VTQSAKRHKALLFDLGRVLVYFDFSRAYRSLTGLCPFSEAEIARRLHGEGLTWDLETGRMEPRDFHALVAKKLKLEIGYERFCEIWTSIFTDALLPESLLEDLAKRYRLILLSNTNAIHFEMIQRKYPHIRHFHELTLSYKVGALKPQEEIYRAAIEYAGCAPEECFYTDDIPEFVEGGKRVGLDAVQFESRKQLERDLKLRGIV